MLDIESNFLEVRRRIGVAAERCGRDPGAITLLAVSKRIEPARVAAAVAAGARNLGESRVQEAEEKIPVIGGEVCWHFIGPLQRNKAAMAARLFDVIHSVGREALVTRLATAASEAQRTVRIYAQVEPRPEAPDADLIETTTDLCRTIDAAGSLQLEGLMMMAPYNPDSEASRPYFVSLRRLRDAIAGADPQLPELGLSMGMSGDFEVAIEEGATIVRVGTAVFGKRPT